jgi:hypothetical protein
MIKRAIEYFPLWTDIRKRYKTSVGGRLVSSLIEESIKIEDTIQEYIDSYFLYNYLGHEDEVMAFVYIANTGELNINSLSIEVTYNDKTFTLAKDLLEFEEHPDKYYYEYGRIYFKESSIVGDNYDFTLTIDEESRKFTLRREHVWNIFDEFATFVNTRRYENETNKELLQRILYITENLPNSTEAGLKHAIISELLTDFPDITEDDIVIENPTPENLIKPYEDYETLLDLLADVNRDIYRTKKWDLDYWQYDFESISYIPHVWDKVVKEWQNGVGSYNDLEVILADTVDSTDATIYFYKKSLETFQKYIYDKYIETDIHFNLIKYEDALNKTNVKYKITASELKDITFDDIKLKIYESKRSTEEIPIQEIATGWGENIETKDKNILTDLFKYKIKFKSKTDHDLIISKAKVIYRNKETEKIENVVDLLKEKNGFRFNSEYELVSSSNLIKIDAVEHFTTYKNLINDEDGRITLDPNANEGQATLSLSNKAGLYVNYSYDCETVFIPESLISSPGGYWNNNKEFILRGDYSTESKQIVFSILANFVSFDILAEENVSATITLKVEDEVFGTFDNIDLSNEISYKTERTDTPRKLTFIIDTLAINDVKFANFKYSEYTIGLSTKYGKLIHSDEGYKLSNFYNNELRLDITAKTGCAPCINKLCIGKDYGKISYTTDIIPYMNNCIRTFEIVSNGEMDLLKLSESSTNLDYEVLETVENYKPLTSYIATENDAYVRIDLSEYESITNIETPVGKIETIEDSGAIFYNIKLSKGQAADYVTVTGIKNREARIVHLIDMVRYYINDFDTYYDTIYCSKNSKGLIISRKSIDGISTNTIVNIKSDAFTGISATKYEMIMPPNLGAIYGSNNGTEHRTNSIRTSFDYISLYPAESQIYTAINTYDTYVKTNKNIPITNNFSPALDMSNLLFFSVEIYDERLKDNIIVRFHNDETRNLSILDMPTWSIGTSNSLIAIENNVDLSNDVSYNVSTFNINDKALLSSSIDIKDIYELTDRTILNTEKFMVKTDNEHITIKYEYYDGTKKKEHLIKYEEIVVGSSGFNKLAYSNIDTIYHISTSAFETSYIHDIIEYELLKDEGIIVWKDSSLLENNIKIYLVYSIRKPKAFVFDLEYLYDTIEFDMDAYEEIGKYVLKDLKNNQYIDLIDDIYHPSLVEDYAKEQPDLIYVSCSEPTFEAKFENDSITFNKYIEENTILVKTGYYYINGREYYLYSETGEEELKNHKLYDANNIDISGGELTTYKPTDNYIFNSEMRLKGLSELYHFDCSKPLTYGVSSFNYLTSCECFNEWNTFGMKMKLTEGLNGKALYFEQEIDNGYSYIDVTDYLANGINYISFYASKDLKVFTGFEERYLYIDFNRAINITLDKEIAYENSDIRYITINRTDDKTRHYLILTANGVIDDIVISTDVNSIYSSHTKNISLLGFDLYEKKPQGSQYKLTLSNHKDYKPYYAGLMSDGSIKTTSNIDWYITKLIDYEFDDDFKKCKLQNIGVDAKYIYTQSTTGYLETDPIYIGDIDNIKQLIFKINNINFENMKDFTTTVYTSNRYNGIYTLCTPDHKINKFHIPQSYLNSYIKIKIEMPPYRYIDNISIFAEYISSNEDPLKIVTKQSGYIESKIYDLQEITNCLVKSLDIIDISNINDVDIYIRGSRDEERLDIWSDWYKVQLDKSLKVSNNVTFNNTRYLQFKVVLKSRKAFIKLKGINIEIR